MPGYQTHDNEYRDRYPHSERSEVVEPLAHVQSDDVKNCHHRQCDEGKHDVVRTVGREVHPRVGAHEQRVTGGEVKNSWKVRQVTGPVRPSGHESGKIAKGAFAPDV